MALISTFRCIARSLICQFWGPHEYWARLLFIHWKFQWCCQLQKAWDCLTVWVQFFMASPLITHCFPSLVGFPIVSHFRILLTTFSNDFSTDYCNLLSVCSLFQTFLSIHWWCRYIVIDLYIEYRHDRTILQLITSNGWLIRLMCVSCILNDKMKYLLSKMFHICLRCEGSNPELGSSKKTTLGFPTREIAKDSLLCIPPDNLLLAMSFHSSKSTSLSNEVIYCLIFSELTIFKSE